MFYFVSKRCMFGSNFPVDKLYITYAELFTLWKTIVEKYAEEEAHYLRYETANQFYQSTNG